MSYKSLWHNVKNSKKHQRRSHLVPARFKKKKERYFVTEIAKEAQNRGCLVHHHDTRNPRNAWLIGPGFPDLVITKKMKRKGRYINVTIWVECKTERGYPTVVQVKWLDTLPKSRTFLWRPSDWKEIIEILNELFGKPRSRRRRRGKRKVARKK